MKQLLIKIFSKILEFLIEQEKGKGEVCPICGGSETIPSGEAWCVCHKNQPSKKFFK